MLTLLAKLAVGGNGYKTSVILPLLKNDLSKPVVFMVLK